MYKSKKLKCLYIISIVCLICFSSMFLFMPITNYVPIEYSRLTTVIIGAIFWVTGIVGYVSLIILYKKIEAKKKRKRKIYIFTNKITIVADIAFLLGFICMILILILNLTSTYLGYLTVFILVMSINAHWIFSGNYLRKL